LTSSNGAAFFDRSSSDSAVIVGSFTNSTAAWAQSGAIPDWGTANAGHGVKVQSGAMYSYVTKPTVNGTLGVGREALVGGTDKLYADVPYIEGANNAALVLTA
jgi:hypothetical protein